MFDSAMQRMDRIPPGGLRDGQNATGNIHGRTPIPMLTSPDRFFNAFSRLTQQLIPVKAANPELNDTYPKYNDS
jgi:hypothetical protein